MEIRSPSKETLYQLYVVERLPVKEIIQRCGISQTQVMRCIHAYGLEREKEVSAKMPTKKALLSLYVEQNLSAEEIAKNYNCTAGNIFFYLRKYGIERDKVKRNSRVPSREQLYHLYVTENHKVEEVAEMMGYSRSRIFHFLDVYGIDRNKRATTIDVEPPKPFRPRPRPHPGPIVLHEGRDRRMRPRYTIDKEWLRARYCDDNLNTPQIAEELGVPVDVINHRLHAYGIPIKPFYLAFRDKSKRFGDFGGGQRRAIAERDNHCCQMCGTKERALECHHIIPTRFGGRNTPDNGILLCNVCHDKVGFHELNWAEELLSLRGTKTGQDIST